MLNDYIIITWSPLTVFLCFLHVSFLIKHSLAKVSHRQKAGRGCGGGRGSRTIEGGGGGPRDSVAEVFVFIILKIFNCFLGRGLEGEMGKEA